MHAIPSHLHHVARFEERRAQLRRLSDIELLVARIRTTVGRASAMLARLASYHERAERCPYGCESFADPESRCDDCNARMPPGYLPQPSMAWFDGPRQQPRDGRGRFLSREWLAEAELFTNADRAWFRHPVSEGR